MPLSFHSHALFSHSLTEVFSCTAIGCFNFFIIFFLQLLCYFNFFIIFFLQLLCVFHYFFVSPVVYATQDLIGHICAPNRIFIDCSQSSRVSQFPGKHIIQIAVLIASCFCLTGMLILLDIFLTFFFSVFATTFVHPI